MKLNVFCVLRIFSFAQPCVLLILRLQVTYHFCILQLLQIPWGACLCAPYSTGKSPQPTSPPALSPHLGHTSAISFPFHFPFAHCVTWTFNREPLLPSPSWKHNPNSYNVTHCQWIINYMVIFREQLRENHDKNVTICTPL